jgi:signal recognition particle subunit SRP54
MIKRQEAIILAMNKRERVQVGLLNASRRKRIAAGSGTAVQDVNKLVKQYQDMARMMKKMGTKSGAAAMKAMLSGGAAGGGMPTAEQMKQLTQQMGRSGNPLGNIQGTKMPGGLSSFGVGGGLPGLGGFPGRKK